MNQPSPPANQPGLPPQPNLFAIGPNSTWVIIVGAIFGAVTLLGLFMFAYLASTSIAFICNSFALLAAIVAFGTGLSASFIGGAAAANGQLGHAASQNVLTYSLGGGIAVMVIAFFVFSIFKPTDEECRRAIPPSPRTQLELQHIPSELVHLMAEDFWVKKKVLERPGAFSVNVLVLDEHRNGEFVLNRGQSSASECSISIHVAREILSLDNHFKKTFNNVNYAPLNEEGESVRLAYNSRPPQRAVKVSNPNCFTFRGRPNTSAIAVSILHNKVIYADSPKEAIEDGLDATVQLESKKEGRNIFNFVSSAFAEDVPGFDVLRSKLGSPLATVRVQARQYLGANFRHYAVPVVSDLFDDIPDDPEYIASLLHGLITGIDAETGGSLGPGRKRDLKAKLPYVAGHEEKIIRLTAHSSDAVKKQARRLIQRYPVDSFLNIYKPALEQARDGNCMFQGDRATSEAIIYGSIFFMHNRIVQKNYSRLTEIEVQDAEAMARLVRDASQCLDNDLRVDAALVYFGLTMIYYEDESQKYKSKAKPAAAEFLEIVGGREDGYYLSSHIEQMKAIAGSE